MRLLLQGEDDMVVSLPDQLLVFTDNGSFSVLPYLAAGYTLCDAYLVGGGGGGGGGGGVSANYMGGSGGGGGGGGGFKQILGMDLSGLAGSESVVIGKGGNRGGSLTTLSGYNGDNGGNTTFHGVTAYGGGGGEVGDVGVNTGGITAGGRGGGGGGADAPGSFTGGSGGGGGNNGGGYGGAAGVSQTPSLPNGAFPGGSGYSYLNVDNVGGGGGGGGGGGSIQARTERGTGGMGGAGKGTYGNPAVKGYVSGGRIDGYLIGAGEGGGGGGGANLTAILGRPGLTNVGAGGDGAAASARTQLMHGYVDAKKGANGIVVVRIYLG